MRYENKNVVETFFRKKLNKKQIHRTKSANSWRNTQLKCKYKSFFDKKNIDLEKNLLR